MNKVDIKRLENGMQWLEDEFSTVDVVQSMEVVSQRLNELCAIYPWANTQMILAKRELAIKKEQTYQEYLAKEQNYLTASLLKDYIAAKLNEYQYQFDLAERLSRVSLHLIEALRSQLAAAREEYKINNYSPTN